jgi:hypothetical protein
MAVLQETPSEPLNPAVVMDDFLYSVYARYYNALEKTGYMSYANSEKLLVFSFILNYVFNDYRGLLSKEDYHLIDNALNCLYGTTCLIPYPDYLKMGKLCLGDISELAYRLKNVEDISASYVGDVPVLKLIHDIEHAEGTQDTDVLVMAEE